MRGGLRTPHACAYSPSVSDCICLYEFTHCESEKPRTRQRLKTASASGRNIMLGPSSASRRLLLAGAFFGAFTLAAAAQQPASPPAAGAAPAAAPLPPGSPMIGRPDN